MIRLIKWCVLPAVLVAGLCVATPEQANAGGFSFSIGYPAYGYRGSYGGHGCDYGYGGHGHGHRGHGYGGHGYGYGGHGYGGHGGHHHHYNPGCFY